MSASTRAGVVTAIKKVIEAERDKTGTYAVSIPGQGHATTSAREGADHDVEYAYYELEEALKEFERNIGAEL